jgi:potassium-transporting ATPase KdpC subunit
MSVRGFVAALRLLVLLTVLLGIAYPLSVTALAQLAFPDDADGGWIRVDGRVVGARSIGQPFDGPAWFHGRPDPHDPRLSGASNLGPSSPRLVGLVTSRAETIRTTEGLGRDTSVPADAVASSGSGLDPHITPAYARLQVLRVAAARGLPPARILALVHSMVEGRTFGFLGEPRVNVLALNVALEGLGAAP